MAVKYEIIEIDHAEITVDVSLLVKTDEMFFNATQMARQFNKRPDDFWKDKQSGLYLDALITLTGGNKKKEDFVHTTRGKYGGTYFHKDLALQFARWLKPIFGVKLDRWVLDRLKKEAEWKRSRLEAKTGYLPLTDAIMKAHEDVRFYHFSNEADLLNKIVFGMSAKKFKAEYDVDDVRDAATAAQLSELDRLQRIDSSMIDMEMSYVDRKEMLIKLHLKESNYLLSKGS